jgi:vacuolar protein sorting-associated protein 1
MLRDIGIEEVISLPKIAVIGNQSSGKSSLIEAISQIKVPRDSGRTCTRCPMEVVLCRGDPENWNCKIFLRFDHEVPQDRLGIFFFAETQEREVVPLLLRRAQLAILHPDMPLREFLNLREEDCRGFGVGAQFCSNSVVLQITGADVDVTFIDLPGIISNTEKVRLRFSITF